MKLFLIVLVALGAGITLAELTPTNQPAIKKRITSAEIRARRKAKIASEGGLVQRPINGKVVRLMTKTSKVPVAHLEVIAKEISELLGFVVECVDGDEQSTQRTGCLIVLNEQTKGPTILVAPEEPWANINVTNLMTDNPDDGVLKTRVTKEIWRAFGYAMGAANSNMQPCLMRPIYGLDDLDSEKVAILCPEPLPGITRSARRLNIAPYKMCSYKHACEEGWAPAPTNEIQKAVWEQVHTPPSKPIKITYDKNKQKPVVK